MPAVKPHLRPKQAPPLILRRRVQLRAPQPQKFACSLRGRALRWPSFTSSCLVRLPFIKLALLRAAAHRLACAAPHHFPVLPSTLLALNLPDGIAGAIGLQPDDARSLPGNPLSR
eukprot:444579-Rhodomonas_salina.3